MAAATARPSEGEKVPTVFTSSAAAEDSETLETQFGYTQELKRSFGLVGMIGFSFNIVTSWTALSGVLIVGVQTGGPAVMIWSWVGVSIVTLSVAYSLAEMCSAFPVAGGQYSWVAYLAPKGMARGFSYICGWFMLIGIIAMGATNNFIGANFVLGMAKLANPEYVIQRWHTTLAAYAMAFFALSVNIFIPKFLDVMGRAMLLWNICSFVVVVTVILSMNGNKQSARFVFSEFQNFSGFSTGFAAMIGLLQTFFGMCCYDAPAHMVEEIRNARKAAPQAILMSVYLGAVTGFIFIIALCFCIGNINNTALTPTLVPLIQIFYHSVGSVVGANALTSLIFVIVLVAANGLMAEGSRAIYAFSRDNGLPLSKLWSKVESKRQVPVYALLLTTMVQLALDSIYFGSYTGFLTVISIATLGFYVSYALPLLARILSHLAGQPVVLDGPYSLGRWSLPLNIIGFIFLTFASITFNLPSVAPVNSQNMNYTSAAVGLIMLIALIFWIVDGRKSFRGPGSGAVMQDLAAASGAEPSRAKLAEDGSS